MSQPQNPLDQLKDIHLPETVNSLEIAPIWWLLLSLLIVFVIVIAYKKIQQNRRLKLIRPAKVELNSIAQMPPNNQSIALLSALLKRICLIYFPPSQVASLNGVQWVDFINQQSQQTLFDAVQTNYFSTVAYQANASINAQAWSQLIKQSEQAIELIIRRAVSEKTS